MKEIWQSRTIWVTLVSFVVTVAGAMGLDLGLDADAQTAIVAGIMAIVGVVMRLVTKEPVRLPGQ